MNTTVDGIHTATSAAEDKVGSSHAYQPYRILQFAFVVAPIIAGLDKFFDLLVNWDQYLPAAVAQMSPIPPHTLMLVVGALYLDWSLVQNLQREMDSEKGKKQLEKGGPDKKS